MKCMAIKDRIEQDWQHWMKAMTGKDLSINNTSQSQNIAQNSYYSWEVVSPQVVTLLVELHFPVWVMVVPLFSKSNSFSVAELLY